MTSPELIEKIRQQVEEGHELRFYNSRIWDRTRAAVLKLDHNECQRCKAAGRYHKAEAVHHVLHLEDRPDLALEIFDPATGQRQLVSLCRACHEREHPERLRQRQATEKEKSFETVERWD